MSFWTKKTQFNLNVFPKILVYFPNRIYPGNPHFMLYQLVQILNDINRYLQFSNSIEFKITFDNKNTSNH